MAHRNGIDRATGQQARLRHGGHSRAEVRAICAEGVALLRSKGIEQQPAGALHNEKARSC